MGPILAAIDGGENMRDVRDARALLAEITGWRTSVPFATVGFPPVAVIPLRRQTYGFIQ
jgi:hypothetical protein